MPEGYHRHMAQHAAHMRRLSFALLACALALGACAPKAATPETPPAPALAPATPLGSVAVTEYRGEALDSTNDFRENSIKGPQYLDELAYRLNVTGLVDTPAQYTYADVTAGDFTPYQKVLQLDCVEGWSVKLLWQGVLVRDLLDASGVQSGAKSVIFHAADGYTTWEPVEYFYDKDILLAYGMNGVKIPPERGYPLMLVAEDKWGYKWCKWVTEIELSPKEDPGGYWEDRGYNNSGDRDRAFYGS